MSKQPLDLSRTWTEAEYLALGETDDRYELIDGKVTVSPSATRPHNVIATNLIFFLRPAAREAGLGTFYTNDLRLRPGTIVCPDIVFGKLTMEAGVGDAADAVLVVEVTSPSNFRWDRGPKREMYAAARIPWYLLAEPDMSDLSSVSLRLLRRDGRRYVEHATAAWGETMVSSEPFPISVDTTLLLEP
ncbi:Uma2 family endonuclease [Paractinoplanes globisporus]|uniref:Uma2 family endonuclease n=1 Tax=Paractinoplanes globisporus TaxID=113565 RepID=A0ABW6WUW2_9ACTN|nr:Uma2 family endonuclease [Actinoplanes globisporus]